MAYSAPEMVFLTREQKKHIILLITMRESELILAHENPTIIDFYSTIRNLLK